MVYIMNLTCTFPELHTELLAKLGCKLNTLIENVLNAIYFFFTLPFKTGFLK